MSDNPAQSTQETTDKAAPAGKAASVPADLRERELKAILHISNMVGSVLRHEDILRIICETTAEAMDCQVCSIYLLDDDRRELRLAATHGLNPAVVGKATLAVGQGLPGWVAEHGQIVSLANAMTDPRFKPIPGSGEEACRAYLCAPLYIQYELIGAMTARKTIEYEFTSSEITLFETICKQVAIVMEKVRLYEDKIEAEKMAASGWSLSEISHYIKNVLQAVQGGSYFVDSGLSRNDLDRARQGWQILKRSNRKIAYLVENMLNYSRAPNPMREAVSMQELLSEMLGAVEETAQRRNVRIEPDIEPGVPPIYADYDSVYNAVLNLVTNAMDAMDEKGGGTLRVQWRRDAISPSQALLTIADTGVGIPPDVQKKIFTLFFSTKGRNGTGIGLAVTKKIVEELGGSISLQSTPGEGTTFTLALPLHRSSEG